MHIFITGATGLIGRALVPRLLRDGHAVEVWARSPERARNLLGAEVSIRQADAGSRQLSESVDRSEAIVNLSGEPIFIGRWTRRRKQLLADSRIGVTARIVEAMSRASKRRRVLISGSAVGFYGNRDDELLDEQSESGSDFLAELCRGWESTALGVADSSTRVVVLRTGIVMARDGGFLGRLLPLFRAALGGPVGSGKQWVPWIHLHDLVEVIAAAITDGRYAGVVNATAPLANRFANLARVLGHAVKRPAFLAVPGFVLRIVVGEAAGALVGGQRVIPGQLDKIGFDHEFSDLERTFADIIRGSVVDIQPITKDVPEPVDPLSPYLAARRPRYFLRSTVIVDAPIDAVFGFFSRPENLGLITPAKMAFEIEDLGGTLEQDATVKYRIRVGGFPIRWITRIASWKPAELFVDVQERGPYHCWWHEHHLRENGARTFMEDRIYYTPPFGPLGRFANRLFVIPELRKIFAHRSDVIRLRFGPHASALPSADAQEARQS